MRRHAHAQKGRRSSGLNRWLQIFFVLGCFLSIPCSSGAQESSPPMTLREAVDTAITANSMAEFGQEIEAARANRKIQKTNLLPTFNASYRGVRNDSGLGGFATGATPSVGNTFTLTTGFTQPLFQGFALINQYKVAELGVNVAELSQKFTRLEVIFQIKQAYFNVLKAEKLLDVAATRSRSWRRRRRWPATFMRSA